MLQRLKALKHKLGPLWWYTALMFGVARLGDIVNLYIGMFLVPSVISQEQLGAVLPLLKFSMLAGVPLLIIVRTGLKFLNVFHVAGEKGKIKAVLRDMMAVTTVLSVAVLGLLWVGRDFLRERLGFEDSQTIWLVGALGIVLTCWVPLATMASQGLKRFYGLIVSNLLAPVVRVVAILLLLQRFQVAGYLASSLASSLVVVVFLIWGIRRFWQPGTVAASYRAHRSEILRYMLPIGLFSIALTGQQAMEPWIIRQRLPLEESAAYYIVALLGNIPLFLSTALTPFLFPLVSEQHERRQATHRTQIQVLSIMAAVGGAIVVVYALFGEQILALHPAWRTYLRFAPFVWHFALISTLSAVINLHLWVENACRRFSYLKYFVPTVFVELTVLYALMGWPFFKRWLPDALWQAVDSIIVRDLSFIFLFMLSARLLTVAMVLLEIRGSKAKRRDRGNSTLQIENQGDG